MRVHFHSRTMFKESKNESQGLTEQSFKILASRQRDDGRESHG